MKTKREKFGEDFLKLLAKHTNFNIEKWRVQKLKVTQDINEGIEIELRAIK